jgi:hypothetical protein
MGFAEVRGLDSVLGGVGGTGTSDPTHDDEPVMNGATRFVGGPTAYWVTTAERAASITA